jgi:GAF domain-containing protein
MLPRFGFTDELRVAFPSRGVIWGGIALYRAHGEPPFNAGDVDQVAGVTQIIGTALARSLFRITQPNEAAGGPAQAQAVLIVNAANRVTYLTASAETAVKRREHPIHRKRTALVPAHRAGPPQEDLREGRSH